MIHVSGTGVCIPFIGLVSYVIVIITLQISASQSILSTFAARHMPGRIFALYTSRGVAAFDPALRN